MDRLTSTQLRDLLEFLRAGYTCHDQEAFVTLSKFTGYVEIDCTIWRVGEIRFMPAEVMLPGLCDIFPAKVGERVGQLPV